MLYDHYWVGTTAESDILSENSNCEALPCFGLKDTVTDDIKVSNDLRS